ncbi:MAG: hypothetical protein GWN37_10565, partial [Gammaproteobacteria bacterium]|nr:hypothetical protein [Gammaproteobacteria bacterium]
MPSRPSADAHVSEPPSGDLASRREALLAHVAGCPTPGTLAAVFHELGRLAAGGPAHVGLFEAALDYVDARVDCADFVMHGILRLLLQFGEDPRLPAGLLRRARETVLGFKYWPDEPGVDSLCSWTENHQILFAAAAHLAGQRHPDAIFANSGLSGRELARVARPRILRWLELRFRTGFSEWL